MRRALLVVAIAAVIAAFFALDLDALLTLERIKQSQHWLQARLADSYWRVLAVYFLAYVAMTAVSIPGAALMTLAGGVLFGAWRGLVIVAFAATVGATLAFLVSRYLLREGVQRHFGDRLETVNAGIAREGGYYLFTLRLVPLFPFVLVNLLMGLTPMRVGTYFAITLVGVLPGTFVFLNAGTQLAGVERLSGLLSPGLIGSFVLLGLLPLLCKRALMAWSRHRRYRRWRRPGHYERNLVVIGAGAAGLVTTFMATAANAAVTLVENGAMGGDCLNYGCVPSKVLLRSAKAMHQVRDAGRFGVRVAAPVLDFPALMRRVRAVIAAIAPHDSRERYAALGAEVLQGSARIVDPWTVEVRAPDGQCRRITTRAIVIATGADPVVPPLPGLAQCRYVTSHTLWDELEQCAELPRRIVVLGGGPVGCELAQAFARLGAHVTQVEAQPGLLQREDAGVAAYAQAVLAADGVEVLCGHAAQRCERDADGAQRLLVHGPAGERTLGFDLLLCAVGRTPRLQGLGLEALGIAGDRVLETNAWLETVYPNIYAAGDVAGPLQFTHAAAHQAWHAAANALCGGLWRFRADYRVIPQVTWMDPEIARVGLNEREAVAQGVAYELARYELAAFDRAIVDGAARGFISVLTAPGRDRLLGATVVGAHAGELIAEFALAMRHGLGLKAILATVHAYPGWNDAAKNTAGAWQRAHAPARLLRWLQHYHRWRRGPSA